MVAIRTNGLSQPSSNNTDPRLLELLGAVRALHEQIAEQARINEEQHLRSQAFEAREARLQEHLTEMQVNRIEATRAPIRAFQQFIAEIEVVAIPQRFYEPSIGTYDGTGDPSDTVSCKSFVRTLTDVAHKWFKGLISQSITEFEELLTNKKKLIHSEDLFDFRQGAAEPLTKYLERFNKVTVRVEDMDEILL